MMSLNRRSILALAGGVASPVLNVRTWTAPEAGVFRNIYALEAETGLIIVDAPLRKSDGAAAREWIAALGRPVRAVLVTHMHPDHTFGLTQMLGGADVPILATRAVADAIRAAEEGFQRFVPNFVGEAETERDRRFPNSLVEPGRTRVVDGISFMVSNVGEAESAADSIWSTPALPGALFSGDLVFHRVHTWVAQGATARYLAVLERLHRDTAPASLFFAGHGGVTSVGAIPRQIAYLRAFRDSVREIAGGRPALTDSEKAELLARMRQIEPSPTLAFGVTVGADAVARGAGRAVAARKCPLSSARVMCSQSARGAQSRRRCSGPRAGAKGVVSARLREQLDAASVLRWETLRPVHTRAPARVHHRIAYHAAAAWWCRAPPRHVRPRTVDHFRLARLRPADLLGDAGLDDEERTVSRPHPS